MSLILAFDAAQAQRSSASPHPEGFVQGAELANLRRQPVPLTRGSLTVWIADEMLDHR